MVATNQRLTKRQRKQTDKTQNTNKPLTIDQLNLNLKNISPITDNQIKVFESYEDGNQLFLHGCAGTGKSFISMYLALKQISDAHSPQRKIVIIRTAQSSKDIGFLPGDEKRKLEVYEAAYRAICAELYERSDAYDILKQKGFIEFHSTSFLRGTTINDAIIILDEVQNMRQQEWFTVLTRTGDKSRVIICGDTKQDDLTSDRYKERSGIVELLRVFGAMRSSTTVQFEVEDIVRSGFVKELILTSYRLGI